MKPIVPVSGRWMGYPHHAFHLESIIALIYIFK